MNRMQVLEMLTQYKPALVARFGEEGAIPAAEHPVDEVEAAVAQARHEDLYDGMVIEEDRAAVVHFDAGDEKTFGFEQTGGRRGVRAAAPAGVVRQHSGRASVRIGSARRGDV